MSTTDFDLALSTLWFTKNPLPLPQSIKAAGPTTHTWSWTAEQSHLGTTKTLIVAVRFTDTLATTKVRLTFDPAKPLPTLRAEQKHFPSPTPPSEDDLDKAHKLYGANIATVRIIGVLLAYPILFLELPIMSHLPMSNYVLGASQRFSGICKY